MDQERVAHAFKAATDAKKVPGVAGIALDTKGNTLFKYASGVTNLGDESKSKPMTTGTPFIIWSCTKLVTSVCALQLLEQGKLKLDDPVEKYVPEMKDLKVFDGVNDDGSPKLREPKSKAKIINLMTHTSGLSYDFFDQKCMNYRLAAKETPAGYVGGEKLYFYDTPLMFDPGTQYMYGTNSDWLGFVVQAISGLKLEEYVQKNIVDVLGLKNTGAVVQNGTWLDDALIVHMRGEDGNLTASPETQYPENPPIRGGGHYLISTIDDYSTFLLAILNGGTDPRSGAQILKKETVSQCLFEDQMPNICPPDGIGMIETTVPPLSSAGEFLPGLKKGWSCGLMLNHTESGKGRSAGSGAWAGLGNVYYWLDPKAGKLGLIGSAVLPFFDEEVLSLFDELERAVYGHDSAKTKGEAGSNFSIRKS